MPTLEWIGKDKVVNHHLEVPYRVLEEQYTYNAARSGNMIIRGDNLEALKALLPQYEGQVKCIYIDPPYNTGNEGWVYNDNVNDPRIKKWLGEVVGKEGEDLSRHDKWLCMMYPRLKLLQRLLAEDGVIFISIGDDENASLKMICNDIFGENNFVDTIIWQKIYTVKNSAQYFSGMHDYIMVFAKSKENFKRNLFPRTEKIDSLYTNPDNDFRGVWTTNAIQARNYYAQGSYEIISPTGKVFLPPAGTYWRVSLERFRELDADNRIWWGLDGKSVPRIKKFLSEAKQGVVPTTFWSYKDAGQNADAKQEIRKIFTDEQEIFTTPKPTRLIERILQIASDSDSIILDSFAGSGTTAHAVLNMNKADGGNRKFILVEMMDYAESITAERVRRVIDGYGAGKSAVEGTGGDFTFYELGPVLLLPDGTLNEDVGAAKIREYVYFMETKASIEPDKEDEPYYMGVHLDSAYYFYYQRDRLTTLNRAFLHEIRTKAERYTIYADLCTLSPAELERFHITFKKIPRDISRL